MSLDTTLLRKCFPANPLVEELGPDDIAFRGLPDTYWCRFYQPFKVWSPLTGEFEIPAGFLSDGASIFSELYSLVLSDTDPRILFAAYGHDYIFSLQGILPNGTILTREQCNSCIGYWMGVLGAEQIKIDEVLLGLAIGSKKYWDASKPAAKVESATK